MGHSTLCPYSSPANPLQRVGGGSLREFFVSAGVMRPWPPLRLCSQDLLQKGGGGAQRHWRAVDGGHRYQAHEGVSQP